LRLRAQTLRGFFVLFPLRHGDIGHLFDGGAVGRAHDAVAGRDLLDAVGAPAGDAGAGENRRVHVLGDVQHAVHKTGIHIDVCAHRHLLILALHDLLNAHLLHALHELKLGQTALVGGQRGGVFLDDDGARVGHGVDGVAEAVNLAGAVAARPVEDGVKVAAQCRIGRGDADFALERGEHLHDLGVGAAVQRALERADRARDGAVGVGAGGGERAADEGGVVAGVLGVQDEHEVEQVRFLRGEGFVLANHPQQIFGHGQIGRRVVDIEGLPVEVVALGSIGVGRDERETADELDRLAQQVLERGVVRAVVEGIQSQHAAGQLIHDVTAGRLENHVLGEGVGHRPGGGEDAHELLLLLLARQMAQQQQIGDLLVAEGAVFPVRLDDVLYADAAVVEFAGHRHAHAVLHAVALDAADLADTDDDTGAVGVSEASLDVLILKGLRRDGVFLGDVRAQRADVAA